MCFFCLIETYKEKAEEMLVAAAALVCYACKKKHWKQKRLRGKVTYAIAAPRDPSQCVPRVKTFSSSLT